MAREAWLLGKNAHRLMEGLPLPAEPRLALASPTSAAWWIHCTPASLQRAAHGLSEGTMQVHSRGLQLSGRGMHRRLTAPADHIQLVPPPPPPKRQRRQCRLRHASLCAWGLECCCRQASSCCGCLRDIAPTRNACPAGHLKRCAAGQPGATWPGSRQGREHLPPRNVCSHVSMVATLTKVCSHAASSSAASLAADETLPLPTSSAELHCPLLGWGWPGRRHVTGNCLLSNPLTLPGQTVSG